MKKELFHLLQYLCSRCRLETKVAPSASKNRIYRITASALLNMYEC